MLADANKHLKHRKSVTLMPANADKYMKGKKENEK